MPTFVSHQRGWGQQSDADVHYPRRRNPRRAGAAAQAKPATRYEGIQMQLVNPVTGKPVFRR